MANSLRGQRVVVVGASAGIGREFALRAIGEGAETLVCGRRVEVLQEVCQQAGSGTACALDVTDNASCESLSSTIRELWGSFDLLLITAGYAPLTYFADVTAESWRTILETNVIGGHQLIRALLPVAAPKALVAALSSETVLQPRHGLGAYTASKAALEMSMRVWRQEHAELRFTTLVIGGTYPTEFGDGFEAEPLGRAFQDWARHGVLQDELMLTEDVAATLTGTLASFIDLPGISLDAVVVRSSSAVSSNSAAASEAAESNSS